MKRPANFRQIDPHTLLNIPLDVSQRSVEKEGLVNEDVSLRVGNALRDELQAFPDRLAEGGEVDPEQPVRRVRPLPLRARRALRRPPRRARLPPPLVQRPIAPQVRRRPLRPPAGAAPSHPPWRWVE